MHSWAAKIGLLLLVTFVAAAWSSDTGGRCVPIDPSYKPTLPRDWGQHTEQRYEYWWNMGLLSVSGANGTNNDREPRFGYLYGLNRCSEQCEADLQNHSYIGLFLITDRETGQTWKNLIFLEEGDPNGMRADEVALVFGGFEATVDSKTGLVGKVFGKLKELALDLSLGLPKSKPATLQDWRFPHRLESLHMVCAAQPVSGTLLINNDDRIDLLKDSGRQQLQVVGTAFTDHYWSSKSCVKIFDAKWKWFLLHVDAGDLRVDMMIELSSDKNMMRLMLPDGGSLPITNFTVTETRYWISKRSKINYPIEHRIDVPSLQLRLEIKPLVDDNEFFMIGRPMFYEGPSIVTCIRKGIRYSGIGTTELKGFHTHM